MGTIASHVYKPSDFSVGQVHEMLVTLGKRGFSPEMAAEVANAKSGKADGIVGLFQSVVGISTSLSDFQSFYHDFLNLDVDFSSVPIPERKPGFDRLILIPQGLTPNQVFTACQKHFSCWRYTDDLDGALDWTAEERNPWNGSYAIWVRDRVEADEELKGLSANQIAKRGFPTETLTERLIHEAKYYSETNRHLDESNITLCAGSRGRGGVVPFVRWVGGNLFVFFCLVRAGGDLRARQAVS